MKQLRCDDSYRLWNVRRDFALLLCSLQALSDRNPRFQRQIQALKVSVLHKICSSDIVVKEKVDFYYPNIEFTLLIIWSGVFHDRLRSKMNTKLLESGYRCKLRFRNGAWWWWHVTTIHPHRFTFVSVRVICHTLHHSETAHKSAWRSAVSDSLAISLYITQRSANKII